MAEGLNRIPPYEWPEGYRAAVVFSADVDVESPYQWANRGKTPQRLGELEQRRFSPRRGLARLVDLLAQFGARGSFYVPGAVMEAYPWIVPGLRAEGHEVGLHGVYHEAMQTLDNARFDEVMDRSLEIYAAQGGRMPVGFRSPSWELAPHQVARLKRPEIAYDSSLMGMDHPYRLDGLTEIPVYWPIDDAIFFRYFGGGRDTSPPTSPAALLEAWLWEFDAVTAMGGLFTITVHPWMSGRASRIEMLRQLFTHISTQNDVWWTTAAEVASWHNSRHRDGPFDMLLDPVRTDF
jgi:peptidoglycan/xylan/chitin deacetylase (PgdA/CDA1 family)